MNNTGATYVTDTQFTQNGYTDTPDVTGTPAFANESPDYGSNTLIESIVNLGDLTAEDKIVVTFQGNWDDNTVGSVPNWEIGSIDVRRDGAVTAMLNVDFAANGPSGFTVVSDPGLAGPWLYRKNSTHRFEINGDTLAADRYVPDSPGANTIIDLNNAKLVVVLLGGTLNEGDSFTLFDLSGGTTLRGTYSSITLPAGVWDVSSFEVDGKIVYTGTPSGIINVAMGNRSTYSMAEIASNNYSQSATPGTAAPLTYDGNTWNQGTSGTNLLDSKGSTTSVDFSISQYKDGPGDWGGSGILQFFGAGMHSDGGHGGGWQPDPGTFPTLSITGLDTSHIYDLYLVTRDGGGCNNTFTVGGTINATDPANPLIIGGTTLQADNSAGNGATWVENQNYVHFAALVPDSGGTITVVENTLGGRYCVNGFQLKDMGSGAVPDYTTWAAGYLPGTDVSNPAGDNDGDGLSNFKEYAFGLNPTSGASCNPISQPLDKGTGMFKYTRRATPSTTGLAYIYEWLTTLADPWFTFDPDPTTSNLATPVEEITVDVPDALLGNSKLFLRVRAE